MYIYTYIYIYIYIYIYNPGPISQVPGLKTANFPHGCHVSEQKRIVDGNGCRGLFNVSWDPAESGFGRPLEEFLVCQLASQKQVCREDEHVVKINCLRLTK